MKKSQVYIYFLIIIFLFIPNIAFAQYDSEGVGEVAGKYSQGSKSCKKMSADDAKELQSTMKAAGSSGNIKVSDTKAEGDLTKLVCVDTRGWVDRTLDQLETWWKDYAKQEIYKSTAIAWRKAVIYLFRQIAYDTATYIATGDKGQKPMFITQGWGAYLKDVGDNAAGTFIEQLGRNKAMPFNLCEPDINVKIQIGLGLVKTKSPTKPACSFTKMKKNWEKELSGGDFLNKFQDMFNPYSNDLGIALTLQTGMEELASQKVNEETQKKITDKGWLSVRNLISGEIKTPASLVENLAKQPIDSIGKEWLTFTGSAAADAVDVFANTLAGQLIEKWMKKGLVNNSTNNSYDFSKLVSQFEAQNTSGGVKTAKEELRKLIEPQFGVRGDYDILGELATCPNQQKAGPTNCVITDNLREAIVTKKTIYQAINEGFLKKDGIFGFKADGYEPNYYVGDFPYRSMIILRKFRILPVGWEIAAQYIKDNVSTVGACNLYDMVSCYDLTDDINYSSGGCKQGSWCNGLVDPNWVLKAPLNYCKREGFGPEIISSNIMGEGEGSALVVNRNDKYCGDEQSCINEKADGSCDMYGYCTEERRTWDYNTDSCEPRNNTCQTFRGSDGNTFSYLENTLDYGNCTADNAGCTAYCEEYDYTAQKYTCASTAGNKIYLDNNAETCDEEKEGCREFIRTKSGIGSNLFVNSSFENTPVAFGTQACSGAGLFGDCSTNLTTSASPYVLDVFTTGTDLRGETYTLSLYAKNCGTAGTIAIDNETNTNTKTTSLNSSSNWQRFEVTQTFTSGSKVSVSINGITNGGTGTCPDDCCLIDGIKVERGSSSSGYSNYRENGLLYEKIIPDYLASQCYETPGVDYRLKSGHPAICETYARMCNQDEAGCELYTSIKDSINIPGKVTNEDYCPAECDGYDNYLQTETTFDSIHQSQFIPSKGKSCSAEYAGCDEFTNLDKVESGGEGKEYYSVLRQCVKTSEPSANCSEFYTWEGSSETGYQLKVFNLSKSGTEPVITRDDSAECSSYIYQKTPADPEYNSDCREFYDNTGQVSYHLLSVTVSCSDNCHPYRRTENNIDESLTTSIKCTAAGSGYTNVTDQQFHWDAADSLCYFCKSGGIWDTTHNACIYMAVPGEGKTCSTNMAGCREYSGSSGNNMMTVTTSDFEGSLQNWTGAGGTTLALSSDSLRVGGESLSISNGTHEANLKLGNNIIKNGSYYLTFVAKSSSGANLTTVSLNNGTVDKQFIIDPNLTLNISNDWTIYKFNISELDHAVTADEFLRISASNEFLIDDIRLVQITDRYFLLKNEFTVPETCYQDVYGAPAGPYHNLGCQGYTDRANNKYYLRRFSHLCQDSAVGCEMVVDTHNSSNYKSEIFNDGGSGSCSGLLDCEFIPADNISYVAYDTGKVCNSSEKGCERLGSPYQYGSDVIYGDTFLVNDPDKYNDILCDEPGAGCGEWTSSEGTNYFKNPYDQTCEWRQAYQSTVWDWYKTKVKKCDINGSGSIESSETEICQEDDNCGTTAGTQIKCILDNTDYLCNSSASKTFGIGGQGNIVYQPIPDGSGNNWVGLCPASEGGCTEYIDPVSKFSGNSVFNANFSDLDGDGTFADGWAGSGPWTQEVNINGFTLYNLSGTDNTGNLKLDCDPTNIESVDAGTNNLSSVGKSITIPLISSKTVSRLIYLKSDEACTISVDNIGSGSVSLRKAIIDYKLRQDIDKAACNGIVDFEQGCVLFNERKQNGASPAQLIWDADMTINDGNGVQPDSGIAGERDSNAVIKVSPDRTCDQWLACRSYIKDDKNNSVCFDIGLCDGLDDNGNCNSFVLSKKNNQSYSYTPASVPIIGKDDILNKSGYSKTGYLDDSLSSDLYKLGNMKQDGELAKIANNGFEYTGDNDYPIGWVLEGGDWSSNVFKVVTNPIEAQTLGIGEAPEGQGFLKLGANYEASSEYIDVMENTDYVLSAYVNTINLSNGTAKIRVKQYDSGSNVKAVKIFPEMDLAAGTEWKFRLKNFKTDSDVQKIRVVLYDDPVSVDASSTGNIFFDDVKISPALQSRDMTPNNTADSNYLYYPQVCRLYPQADSLSCVYYDDSWKYQKGWTGYCLEYDRYPGNPKACILWYPIDKVKGEGIEEGAGYLGKVPVYYCAEAKALIPLEYRHVQGNIHVCEEWYDGWACGVPGCYYGGGSCVCTVPGYSVGCNTTCDSYSVPDGTCLYDCTNSCPTVQGWYEYNGFDFDEANYGLKYYNPASGEVFDDVFAYCTKVVQVVNNIGDNKYWAGRVYEGSKYTIPGLLYGYKTDLQPFGAIKEPDPSNNPYEWDGGTKADRQPLYVKPYTEEDLPRASHPYKLQPPIVGSYGVCQISGNLCLTVPGVTQDKNKADCEAGDTCITAGYDFAGDPYQKMNRIFAKSYGIWTWSSSTKRYEITSGDWDVPTTECVTNPRPAYPSDFCGIAPIIDNVGVNGATTGSIDLYNTQFVNLTFNSTVDSQQMPLVMYSIDWGDGEKTVVTGVEMRDRPNPDNPHSFYHLYSYWDLKAKYNLGTSGIDCSTVPGTCRITPKILIKDNWSWCSRGTTKNDCDSWQNYNGTIVVHER